MVADLGALRCLRNLILYQTRRQAVRGARSGGVSQLQGSSDGTRALVYVPVVGKHGLELEYLHVYVLEHVPSTYTSVRTDVVEYVSQEAQGL